MTRWLNYPSFSPPLLTTGAAIMIGAVSTPVYSQANPEFTRQVIAQLDTLTTQLEPNGYVEVMSYIDEVGLQENESRTWDLTLEPNAEYVITAVCDDDCQTLGLTLLEDNAVVGEHRDETPYPRITGLFGSSSYQVTVTMGTCQIEPCY
ncbi:MAG: hypothetical protein F6K09_24580, partial [Merismopedia sp. SIO2A8]|nr:hypothetical protein [Merismopedia sp. SIO2A8]